MPALLPWLASWFGGRCNVTKAKEVTNRQTPWMNDGFTLPTTVAENPLRFGHCLGVRLPPFYRKLDAPFDEVVKSVHDPRPTVIQGVFGMGKTTLACAAGLQFIEDGWRVFWLECGPDIRGSHHASRRKEMQLCIDGLLGRLYFYITGKKLEALGCPILTRLRLEEAIDEKIVVVLDDVHDGLVVRRFTFPKVKLIVTTQMAGLDLAEEPLNVRLTMGNCPFTEQAVAQELLARSAELPGTAIPEDYQATVDAVLQQCRGQPLAIVIAGRALLSRLIYSPGDQDAIWECWGRELVLELRTRVLPPPYNQNWAIALAGNCEHRKGDTLLEEFQAMLAESPSVEG